MAQAAVTAAPGIASLLRSRRFLPFFVTQFLGAFNDNLFKSALLIWAAFGPAERQGYNPALLVTLAAGLFILPFFLFSATAGTLADKHEKGGIIRAIKLAEIAIMVLAAAGFYLGHVSLLLVALFLMGTHSAFFGPVKYAILPDHLQQDELIAANALVEGSTFLAILLGTVMGGLLIAAPGGAQWVPLAALVVAGCGYAVARQVPPAPPPAPGLRIEWNIPVETWRMMRYATQHATVFHAVLGISWFWLVGATFLAQFPTYTAQVLGADERVVTLFLTMFSVGIAIGSLLCNRLLKGKIHTRFVPLAALGLTVFIVDFYFASHAIPLPESGTKLGVEAFLQRMPYQRLLLDLTLIAICGGLYIVPLYAVMQTKAAPEHRARMVASNNVLNALFMVLSALGSMAILAAGFTADAVLLTVGALNALALPLMLRWYGRTAG